MRYQQEKAGSMGGWLARGMLVGVLLAVIGMSVSPAPAAPQERSWNLPFSSEDELLDYLRTARVVSQKKIKTGINQPQKVRLQKDGVQLNAVFRDVDERIAGLEINRTLRTDFRDNAIFEVAAYRLSRMLGLDLVPPTVERKIYGKKGSLQLWIEGAFTEGERIDRKLTPPDQQQWAQLRQIRWIFDALVHNDDRNLGNSLIDQNWSLWLIDHTRCFYPFDRLLMEDQLTHIDAALWEKLKSTSQELIRAEMKRWLERREIEALLHRWTRLVAHYQSQIDERGEAHVLFRLSN